MKRKLTIIVAFLIFMILILRYTFSNGERKQLFSAVPKSAIALLEVSQVQERYQQLQEIPYWKNLSKSKIVKDLIDNYQLVDSVIVQLQQGTFKQATSMVASLHITKVDEVGFVLLRPTTLSQETLLLLLQQQEQKGAKLSSHIFRGLPIYQLQWASKNERLCVTLDNGLLVSSKYPFLVDEVVQQMNQSAGNGFWKKARKPVAGEAQLHLNFANTSSLSKVFLQSDETNFFHYLQNNATWQKLGISFKETGIALEGLTELKKNNNCMQAVLKAPPHKGDLKIANIVPFNTCFLSHFQVANFKDVYHKNQNHASDFDVATNTWMGNEWAYGFVEPTSEWCANTSFLAMEYTDKLQVEETLKKYSVTQIGSRTVTYNSMDLRPIDMRMVANYLVGEKIGTYFGEAYYTLVGDFVLVSSNLNFLKVMLDNYTKDQVLAQEADFANFLQGGKVNSNTFIYATPTKMKTFFDKNSSKKFGENIAANFNSFVPFSPVYLQLSGKAGNVLSQGFIPFASPQQNATQQTNKTPATLVWSTPLSAPIKMQPQVLLNYETKEPQILVQDVRNQLYLINNDGKIAWRRELAKPILNTIQQIDFHNNGVLYYIFNTQDEVYVLDKDGRDANNYPIQITWPAAAGLGLVDFKGDKNEEFFIPCTNSTAYGYEYSARPLRGWSPKVSLPLVTFPPKIMRGLDGREMLVLANERGVIYLLAENGDFIHQILLNGHIIAAPEVDNRKGEEKVVVTTKNGETHVINAHGHKWGRFYINISTTHDFCTANITGDELEEYVYMTNAKVYVFDASRRLLEYTFPNEAQPNDIFEIQLTGRNFAQIGAYCGNTNNIFLLENAGNNSFHPDFPLQASSPFVVTDLFSNGKNVLVAGGLENNIFAYQLR